MRKRGFTLIELLVVVAIIGILAAVVLASLNSARAKGKEASIKSNLKNMIAAAELSYDTNGNYSGACAAAANMITSITGNGGISACVDNINTGRWGASAGASLTENKNWSVDSSGVVAWTTSTDTPISWEDSVPACAALGGKLPTVEQLKALRNAYGVTPPGFQVSYYWSSTTVPTDNTKAYAMYMSSGNAVPTAKTGVNLYGRCVK